MLKEKLSRREFIKLSCAAAAGFLVGGRVFNELSSCVNSPSSFANEELKKEKKEEAQYQEIKPEVDKHFQEIGLTGRHKIKDFSILRLKDSPLGYGVITLVWYKSNDLNPKEESAVLHRSIHYSAFDTQTIQFDDNLKEDERYVDVSVCPNSAVFGNFSRAISQYESGTLPSSLRDTVKDGSWSINFTINLPNSDSFRVLPENYERPEDQPVII
jgi:hypothetical protein